MERKARKQQLAGDLQRSTAFEAAAAKELLGLMLEDAKEEMLDAQPSDLLFAQGRAKALREVLILLTKPGPKLREE